MTYLWDYDKKELEKSERGRIFILERMINYGPGDEKIKLADVKKYWNQLNIYFPQRRLLELLIWGRYISSRPNRNSFSIKYKRILTLNPISILLEALPSVISIYNIDTPKILISLQQIISMKKKYFQPLLNGQKIIISLSNLK